MASRALIIAVEEYPHSSGEIEKTLKGTLQAGLDFRSWLDEKWKNEGRSAGDTQILFCSSPQQEHCLGANREDILNALRQLRNDGRDATDELFVFFSGHGLMFVPQPGNQADCIIAADFVDRVRSGYCCAKIDEIIIWLHTNLGAGKHYYFIDACRSTLDSTSIQVGNLLTYDQPITLEASIYCMQSTAAGAVAAANGQFSKTLLDGLRGSGKAKVWQDNVADAMFVRYDSLRNYLKNALQGAQRISHKVQGEFGESDAVLNTIRPVPISRCRIDISDVGPNDQGRLAYRGRNVDTVVRNFTANPPPLTLAPDTYTFTLTLDGAAVDPDRPLTADVYENCTLNYRKLAPPSFPPPSPSPSPSTGLESMTGPTIPEEQIASLAAASRGSLEIVVPQKATLKLRNIDSGKKTTVSRSETLELNQGRYIAELYDSEDKLLKKTEQELQSGTAVKLDMAQGNASVPRDSIAKFFPAGDGRPHFSESLGNELIEPDFDLWLAITGGGRIMWDLSDNSFEKFSSLPLYDFRGESTGSSGIYVLAGFEANPDSTLRVSVSSTAAPQWRDATQPKDMAGIRECFVSCEPGSKLVTFQVGEAAPYTIASFSPS